ncbi:MAG: NUDIX domain-containing protein [Phycisphaerales bacterium JB041]
MSAPADKPLARSLGWVTRSRTTLHKSRWFDVHQDRIDLPDGGECVYTYVDHPGAVFVVPVTPEGAIILLKSFRYTCDDWCIEVPAGGMGDQGGAAAEQVVAAELREELGCEFSTLEHLSTHWMANGYARNRSAFFLARDAVITRPPSPETTELFAAPLTVPPSTARRMVRAGEINDGESAFAVMLALDWLREHED